MRAQEHPKVSGLGAGDGWSDEPGPDRAGAQVSGSEPSGSSGQSGSPGRSGSSGRGAGSRRTRRSRLAAVIPLRGHLDEAGITTAEYAVGTAAGAGFAGLLYKMLTGGFGDKLLGRFFDHVMKLLGIG